MDRSTRKVIVAFGGFAIAFGALFVFFVMGWTGSIRMLSIDVWVGLVLSGASMVFFLASIVLLATGKVRLPESKAPPSP